MVFPPGRWRNPVALTIKDGRVVDIQGKTEADQVRWFLETYGDESSWLCGGEMALGLSSYASRTRTRCAVGRSTMARCDFGIGHGADRGKIVSVLRLEGIIEKITMIIDDTVVCDSGKILV